MTQTINLTQAIRGILSGEAEIHAVFLGEDKLWEKEKYPVEVNKETLQTVFNPEHADYDKVATYAAILKSVLPPADAPGLSDVVDLQRMHEDINAIVSTPSENINREVLYTVAESVVQSAYAVFDTIMTQHYEKPVQKKVRQFYGLFAKDYISIEIPNTSNLDFVILDGIVFDAEYGQLTATMHDIRLTDTSKFDEIKAIFQAKGLMIDESRFVVNKIMLFKQGWNTPQANEFDLISYLSSI